MTVTVIKPGRKPDSASSVTCYGCGVQIWNEIVITPSGQQYCSACIDHAKATSPHRHAKAEGQE